MTYIDTQEAIAKAWNGIKVPEGFVIQYGKPEIWDYDGRLSRPFYVYGTLIDKECLWITAQDSEGNFTGAGIAFSRREEIGIDSLLQTTLDQWEALSHPFKEGDVLPEPRNLYFEKDGEGQVIPLRQTKTLDTVLCGRELAYYYNRNEYRIERVSELCNEQQEAFKLVRKG